MIVFVHFPREISREFSILFTFPGKFPGNSLIYLLSREISREIMYLFTFPGKFPGKSQMFRFVQNVRKVFIFKPPNQSPTHLKTSCFSQTFSLFTFLFLFFTFSNILQFQNILRKNTERIFVRTMNQLQNLNNEKYVN